MCPVADPKGIGASHASSNILTSTRVNTNRFHHLRRSWDCCERCSWRPRRGRRRTPWCCSSSCSSSERQRRRRRYSEPQSCAGAASGTACSCKPHYTATRVLCYINLEFSVNHFIKKGLRCSASRLYYSRRQISGHTRVCRVRTCPGICTAAFGTCPRRLCRWRCCTMSSESPASWRSPSVACSYSHIARGERKRQTKQDENEEGEKRKDVLTQCHKHILIFISSTNECSLYSTGTVWGAQAFFQIGRNQPSITPDTPGDATLMPGSLPLPPPLPTEFHSYMYGGNGTWCIMKLSSALV